MADLGDVSRESLQPQNSLALSPMCALFDSTDRGLRVTVLFSYIHFLTLDSFLLTLGREMEKLFITHTKE